MIKSWEKRNEALLLKIKQKSFRAYQLAKSNYGRDYGWYIEFEGKRIGELINPKSEDMFWESYQIISTDKNYKDLLFDREKWLNVEFKFRNKEIEEYATHAFPGGIQNDLKENDRVMMRALYLSGENTIEERLLHKYSSFYSSRRIKKIPMTSHKLGSLKLEHSIKTKNGEKYLIYINNKGVLGYRHTSDDGISSSHRFEINPKVLDKIQLLLEEYALFETSPRTINSWNFIKVFFANILKKGTRSISLINDLEERYLDFELPHWRATKKQKELILLFEEIEQLVQRNLPNDSFIH